MSRKAVYFIQANLIVLFLLTGWMSFKLRFFAAYVGHTIFPFVRYGDDGRMSERVLKE